MTINLPPGYQVHITPSDKAEEDRTDRRPSRAPVAEPAPTIGPEPGRKDTYEFGYEDRICPEQFVAEANSLMNYVFDKVAENGGQRLHAYAFSRSGDLYTGIRDSKNNIVRRVFFPRASLGAQEFVGRVEAELNAIGIGMDDYVDIVYRDFNPDCR